MEALSERAIQCQKAPFQQRLMHELHAPPASAAIITRRASGGCSRGPSLTRRVNMRRPQRERERLFRRPCHTEASVPLSNNASRSGFCDLVLIQVKSAKRVPFFRLPKKTHKPKLGWEFATKESKNGTQMPRQKCQRVPFFRLPKKTHKPSSAKPLGESGPTTAGISDFVFRTSYFGLWTLDFGLRTLDFGLRTSDFGLRTSDFRPRTSDFGLRTSDFRPRTSDFGLRTSDFRPRTSDFGLRTSDFRLPTSASSVESPYFDVQSRSRSITKEAMFQEQDEPRLRRVAPRRRKPR